MSQELYGRLDTIIAELRAIHALLEGAEPSPTLDDVSRQIEDVQSASELVRLGILRRHA